MTILIVDDHPTERSLLRAQLEAKGPIVLEAGDGVEALQVLESEIVDAIISDLLMPTMDGYRLCQEVRKSEKLCILPFIVYTATYTFPSDHQLAQMVGADRYLVKGSSVELILEAIAGAAQTRSERTISCALLPDEITVLKQYSVVLVRKLEEKNAELHLTLAKLEREREHILELNQNLEERVAQRTAELEMRNRDLVEALTSVKELSGLIPICAYCKKIRDDEDYWHSVESYISRHTTAQFSHGVCPECLPIFRGDLGLPRSKT